VVWPLLVSLKVRAVANARRKGVLVLKSDIRSLEAHRDAIAATVLRVDEEEVADEPWAVLADAAIAAEAPPDAMVVLVESARGPTPQLAQLLRALVPHRDEWVRRWLADALSSRPDL